MRRFAAFRIGVLRFLVVALLGVFVFAFVFAASGPAARSFAGSGPVRLLSRSDMSRVLYASDWTGPTQIFALDPSGRVPPRQITTTRTQCAHPLVACGYADPAPSPDGRHVVFRTTGDGNTPSGAIWLSNSKRQPTKLADAPANLSACITCGGIPYAAWTHDSRRVVFAAGGVVHVANADGSHDRVIGQGLSPLAFVRGDQVLVGDGSRLRALAAKCNEASWSADGRWLACATAEWSDGSLAIDVTLRRPTGSVIADLGRSSVWPAWAPSGATIALSSTKRGIEVADARTRRVHALTSDAGFSLTWSPDGRAIAYVTGGIDPYTTATGDIRMVTLGGVRRTLTRAASPTGGHIVAIAWTRGGRATRGTPVRIEDGLLASGEVDALATAGDRVAYVACGRGYVWTPPTPAPLQLPPPPQMGVAIADDCHPAAYFRERIDAIAIGNRTALYGWCDCPMGFSEVRAVDLGTPTRSVSIGSGTGTASESLGSGTLMGDRSLLVFSTWAHQCCTGGGVTEQRILRVDSTTCPCTEIGSRAGRLQPLDVDAGRMLVDRGDFVSVMTSLGDTTTTIPVRPIAAQLTGNAVVVTVAHELRVYDATTGSLAHTWPLPEVVSGRDCQGWFDPACWDEPQLRPFNFCAGGENEPCPSLRLEDASHGLAAYILDGRVHLLRLSDGADGDFAFGTVARFSDAGLVYADGSRIHIVPFAKLPLH